MVLRITRLPQELFSSSTRNKDQFYGSVAKYLTVEEALNISFFGNC